MPVAAVFLLRAVAVVAVLSMLTVSGICRAAERDGDSTATKPRAHIRVRGKVVDPDGRPQPNARVVLRVLSTLVDRALGTSRVADILAETKSDEAGRFAFVDAPLDASQKRVAIWLDNGRRGADVVALADGFAVGWTPLYAFSSDDVTVALQPAAALEGTVVDDADTSVPSALVEVAGVDASLKIDGFSEHPKNLDLTCSSMRLTATTDAAGRFRVEGLPSGRYVCLWVKHADFPHKYFVASVGDPPLPVGHEIEIPLSASPVRLVVDRGPRLLIRVTDHVGKPVDGGWVSMDAISQNGGYSAIERLADGAVRMAVRAAGGYHLHYLAPESEPGFRLTRRIKITEATGQQPQVVELRVPQLRVLQGQ